MNKQDNMMPYVRFLLSIQKPDLDGVRLDGSDCAEKGMTLNDNPHPKGSKEYLCWNEGWWSGFYEEESMILFSATQAKEPIYASYKKANEANAYKELVNNALVKSREKLMEWVESFSLIFGTLIMGYVSYELVDIMV